MSKCDYCNKEIDVGYLGYDFYVIREDCIKDLYTKEELDDEYDEGNIFWTTFYDED